MCNSTGIPYEESRPLLVAVYSIVFAVGLPANCLTATVTLVQIRRENITAIYLFGLSLCELMYLSTIPLWIIYVQNHRQWMMGELACKVTGYIFFCNIYISILLLCCISIDRYVAVVYALESRGKWCRCQRTAAAVTVSLFAMVAVIYCPVFFDEDIEDQAGNTCFEAQLNPKLAYFNIIRFFVGFSVPFMLLIFMNYKVFQSIKTSCSLSPFQKRKVKSLAIAVIAIFVVCFAPYHCMLLVRALFFFWYSDDARCQFERSIYTTYVVFLCFSTANAVADPFIYVLASENARREISRTFRACGIQFPVGSKTDSSKSNDPPKSPKEIHTLGTGGDR